MLESLTVKNFGIIELASLELTPQLNILTGETGAGKSILIDALRLCLGERFQTSYLHDDGAPCTVEVVFKLSRSLQKAIPALEDFPCEDGRLIIQRSIAADGKNRIRINGLTATVAQLKDIGDALIDFHGPHDHQQLLAQHRHLEILDTLTDLEGISESYTALYKEYNAIIKQIADLQELAQGRERDLDLLAHQIKELEQVSLDENACEETGRDQIKIANAEKLYQNISEALSILENDEAGVSLLLSRSFKPLQTLAHIDERSSEFLDRLSSIQDRSAELISTLKDYADSLSFDPEAAKQTNARFDAYQDIKRKYGPSLSDAKIFYDRAKEKYDLLSDFEHNAGSLEQARQEKETALLKLAKSISVRRKKSAEALKDTIEKELRELGFKAISFEARIEKKAISPDGVDNVTFFISTNAGENVKPLADIISSGEAARIMLAIKRALMKVDPVPVLIFDEIDAQIGGRLGTVIGTKLSEIAKHRQVILITHLPQIAAFAQTHFRITKAIEKGKTRVIVNAIEGKDRTHELAHMMSGDKMTDTAVKHALEMIKEASGRT